MPGSILIAEKDRSRLATIATIESIESFVHLELELLTTIDFETFTTDANVAWAEGEPVVFDEAQGMAIFKVSEAGLGYLLDHGIHLPREFQDDVRKIAAFVASNGRANIYECTVF